MSMKHADHATPWTRAPSSSRPGWYACRPSLVLGTCFNARTIFKNKCVLSHFGPSWVYKAQSHWCPKKDMALFDQISAQVPLAQPALQSHEPQPLFRVHEQTTPPPLANMETFGRLAEQSSFTIRGMGLAWHGCRVN